MVTVFSLALGWVLMQDVPSQIVGYVPDPRMPMPTPWKDPGYLNIWWIQSPNFNKRPEGSVVDTIVVHSTVIPTLENTTAAFQRTESQVSAHFTIGRDGSIVQNVSTFDRAWHAGVSKDASGRENLNHYSIGIELVNLNDGKQEYPEAQIRALQGIIGSMKRRFCIKQIVSHEYIAQPPGRKSDPMKFPWERLEYFGIPIYKGQNKG
ncbi:MAG: N-acetylmuramoyl-L-alanine amidase [Fimbriimonas sp.]